MKPLKINALAFDSAVMKSNLPVFLVFGAVWDKKSRELFDFLDQISEKCEGKLKLCKVDLDYVQDIFHDLEVYDIPTIMIIEDGKVFNRKLASGRQDAIKMIKHFFGVFPN
jgi:thioredoxin 1